jgi:transmembrane sensor
MDDGRIKVLFYNYFNETSCKSESRELAVRLQKDVTGKEAYPILEEAWDHFHVEEKPFSVDTSKKILRSILASPLETNQKQSIRTAFPSWPIAACLATFIFSITAIFLTKKTKTSDAASVDYSSLGVDALVKDQAWLTLANGEVVDLSKVKPGPFTTDFGASVTKLENNRLVYEPSESSSATTTAYHVLRTSKGGQYQVVLPDSTHAWLNASSSISFPLRFSGSTRSVKIEGEVFFDVPKKVVKGDSIPFTVSSKGVSIVVLGTQFNVNAYGDELETRTTLVEGAVRVETPSTTRLLRPGQEARTQPTSSKIKISEVDLDEIVAWKRGVFYFKDASIHEIMQQLSRWYGVEVFFEGDPFTRKFSGEISRSATLMEVLEILELSKIQPIVSENKIIIRT